MQQRRLSAHFCAVRFCAARQQAFYLLLPSPGAPSTTIAAGTLTVWFVAGVKRAATMHLGIPVLLCRMAWHGAAAAFG